MSEQDIVESYEGIFLTAAVGHVETQVADLTDEAYVRAIFDDPLGNPNRALVEILTRGAKGRGTSGGRYEFARDIDIAIEVHKAFELDAVDLKHDPVCAAAARNLWAQVHTLLLIHANIAAGSNNRGCMVQSVGYEFNPNDTPLRGEWACFKAVFRPVFLNQPTEN